MATIITMPRLSDTMEEGTVASWLKNVGDAVSEGDILAEIETDKATMEFESFHEGTLLHIGIAEGETANVDDLLAIIGDKGEDISIHLSPSTSKTAPVAESKGDSQQIKEVAPTAVAATIPEGVEVITMPRLSDTMEEGTVATWLKKEGDSIQEGETALVDALLAIVGPAGTDVSGISQSTNTTTVATPEPASVTAPVKETPVAAPVTQVVTEVASTNSSSQRIFASPLAKKMANDKGISLQLVKGSGENGRIVKSDIENYQPSASPMAQYTSVGVESFEEVKNSQMRKTIAKRLGESKFSAPHYYLTIELDMDNTMASRAAINSAPDVKISYNDMIVKACAMALRKHPQVNSQWTDGLMRIAKHIHVGVAVAVDDGLLVPVLKFADQMSFSQIGVHVKELAGKARNKKITPQEMDGSTFTVSNLGMFGIKEFTSIINAPNSAILSVGAIIQKPVVKNGTLAVGNTMTVTLACDHRTVDGATGAKFLQTLRNYIENPVTMFV